MKKATAIMILVIASALISQAETQTVSGRLERSRGGSHTFVLRDPSIDAMDNTVYTAANIQDEFDGFEGKEVTITGDLQKRPRGDTVIKSVDSIAEVVK